MQGGGAERVMSIIAPAIARCGHEVLLASNFRRMVYSLPENVRQFDIFRKKAFLGLSIFLEIFRLILLLKKERPDVVVTFLSSASLRMYFASFFTRTPWIVSEHSSFEQRLSVKNKILRCFLPRKANCVVLLSSVEAGLARSFFKKTAVIPNPLSIRKLSNWENQVREASVCLCGDLSRYKQKGFDKMIQNWTEITKRYPNWKLVIIGGENSGIGGRQYLERLVKQYGLESCVDFLGRQSEIANIFSSQRLYVSCSEVESFSMTTIEAMSQGCMCISFANAGPRSIIKNEETGYLVERGNWKALTEKICEVIEMSEDSRRTITKNAMDSLDKYELSKVISCWESLIMEVIQ